MQKEIHKEPGCGGIQKSGKREWLKYGLKYGNVVRQKLDPYESVGVENLDQQTIRAGRLSALGNSRRT